MTSKPLYKPLIHSYERFKYYFQFEWTRLYNNAFFSLRSPVLTLPQRGRQPEFYKSKIMSATLLRVSRAIGRSKLTESNFFESQPKRILCPKIIKNSKFLILCLRKNKSNSYIGL